MVLAAGGGPAVPLFVCQVWDYLNHLFRVVAPESYRGYVSFISTPDGKNLVKRKWFCGDGFQRRESHT